MRRRLTGLWTVAYIGSAKFTLSLANLTSASVRSDGREIQRRFGEKNAEKVVGQIEQSKSNTRAGSG